MSKIRCGVQKISTTSANHKNGNYVHQLSFKEAISRGSTELSTLTDASISELELASTHPPIYLRNFTNLYIIQK